MEGERGFHKNSITKMPIQKYNNQDTRYKQIPKSKFQYWILVFDHWLLFGYCFLVIVSCKEWLMIDEKISLNSLAS
jgi:hypothetical protein